MSKPLKVICIRSGNSTKLIKGGVYSVLALYTRSVDRTIYLKDVGNYNIKNFTLLNGDLLDNTADFNTMSIRINTEKNNYTGQFVVGRTTSGKSLKEGEIYYVEEHRKIIEKRMSYGGQLQQYTIDKFKIRGIKNLLFAYNFEEIEIKEQRHIKLKYLKGEVTKTGDQTRKFLLYTEKEKTIILFDILAKALIDLKYVELDKPANIIEMMIIKGKKYVVNEDDIKSFLSQKIEKSLKLF